MGKIRQTLLFAGALVALPLTAAHAGGDFRFPPAPEPITQIPQPVAIPQFPAWYVRGDLGWAMQEDPDVSENGIDLGSPDMDDTWTLGGGLGYFFTDNVRGDLTLDYRFDADVTGIHPQTGDAHQTGVSNTVGLANVYYDIRGRDVFTPYVGVGAGFSYNESDNHDIYTNGTLTGSAGGKGNTDFAFAAMAGFSYRVNDGVLLDAGYRYLNMGAAETDNSPTAGNLQIDDMQAHELRFGFRLEFQ